MREYSLSHLTDSVLLRDLSAMVARDRLTTATLLAHIAEVDARQLYVPAGCSSMHAYCVEHLRLSDDAAAKRIHAARAARRFPSLFGALTEGRLHLTAIWLLAPHLTPENADELIAEATHRRKIEIEELLARRFTLREVPRPMRILTPLRTVAPQAPGLPHAPGHVASLPFDFVDAHAPAHARSEPEAPAPDAVRGSSPPDEALPGEPRTNERLAGEHAPGHVDPPPPEERFLLRLAIGKSTRDKLRYAQALLSHVVRADDMVQVLDRALDSLIAKLEKQKLGSAARRSRRKAKTGKRYVPPEVRQVVWQRDGGQCTFVSAKGHRCTARRLLEFDHVQPVARGGTATVEAIRLRCRAHNQYEAERAFGPEFMSRRKEARRATARAGLVPPAPVPRTESRTAPGTPGTPPPRHDAGTIVSPP